MKNLFLVIVLVGISYLFFSIMHELTYPLGKEKKESVFTEIKLALKILLEFTQNAKIFKI